MFLNQTIKRNKKLIDFAYYLHKEQLILPDTYVIDVDTLMQNTEVLSKKALKKNIELYYMSKQIGRNPYLAAKIVEAGIKKAVVVDFKEALVFMKAGLKLGNVGHVVQIPEALLEKIILYGTDFITVYSFEILKKINEICEKNNIIQKIMLRIVTDSSALYDGQYGGFNLQELENNIEFLKTLQSLNICGLTTFPCITYFENEFILTKNAKALDFAKQSLVRRGILIDTINVPSATCVDTLDLIASVGNQGEPGHALTGTTPKHATFDLDEIPCLIYVSEISHNFENKSYCYGGGYYRRGHLENALVFNNDEIIKTKVYPLNSEAIDYYVELDGEFNYGATVISSFRTQIFVTRSNIAIVEGIHAGKPKLIGIYDSQGNKVEYE